MDLQKTRKYFDVFMNLNKHKTYNSVDRKGKQAQDLWLCWQEGFRDVLRIYGMRGHPLARIRSFYEDINASVHISAEPSQEFQYCCEMSVCDATVAVQNLYGWV